MWNSHLPVFILYMHKFTSFCWSEIFIWHNFLSKICIWKLWIFFCFLVFPVELENSGHFPFILISLFQCSQKTYFFFICLAFCPFFSLFIPNFRGSPGRCFWNLQAPHPFSMKFSLSHHAQGNTVSSATALCSPSVSHLFHCSSHALSSWKIPGGNLWPVSCLLLFESWFPLSASTLSFWGSAFIISFLKTISEL